MLGARPLEELWFVRSSFPKSRNVESWKRVCSMLSVTRLLTSWWEKAYFLTLDQTKSPFISFVSNSLFKSLKYSTVFMALETGFIFISLTWFYNRHFFTSKYANMLKRYQDRLNRKMTVIVSHPLINSVPRNYPMLSDWLRCPSCIIGAAINSCSLVVSI